MLGELIPVGVFVRTRNRQDDLACWHGYLFQVLVREICAYPASGEKSLEGKTEMRF
jgi:hypothetical protein